MIFDDLQVCWSKYKVTICFDEIIIEQYLLDRLANWQSRLLNCSHNRYCPFHEWPVSYPQ